MKNFIFKSTDADLQKMFQQLGTIQNNVLYLTHVIDRVAKIVSELNNSSNLQKQVDDFYEDPKKDD